VLADAGEQIFDLDLVERANSGNPIISSTPLPADARHRRSRRHEARVQRRQLLDGQLGKLLPIINISTCAIGLPKPRSTARWRRQNGPEESPPRLIERLADLQQKGILSPEEFAAKKAELLSRL
jgi:Short C-terminal domain